MRRLVVLLSAGAISGCTCAQLPDALFPCEPNGTCGQAGYTCGPDNLCRPEEEDAGCGPVQSDPLQCGACGRVCASGTCLEAHCTCQLSADCPSGFTCGSGGLCLPTSDPCSTVKCPLNQVCRAPGLCVPTTCAAGCLFGEVCQADAGLCRAVSACRVPQACGDGGICEGPARPDGTSCDDGQACTFGDQCALGTCAGTLYSCSGNRACQDNVVCAGDGGCVGTPKLDGTPCNDGVACSFSDHCQAGACTGTSYSCPASTTCEASIQCLGDGGCAGTPVNEGGACDDGVACSRTDRCASGTCVGIAYTCPAPTACQQTVACAGDGGCIVIDKNNGDPCDDGQACTSLDVCNAGVCAGTPGTSYRDSDGDGHGDSAVSATGCPAPVGYVSQGGDCDDTDPDIFQSIANLVTDGDGDGYSTGAAAPQCVGASTTIAGRTYYRNASGNPTWLLASESLGADCDDTNPTLVQTVGTLIADADNDGYAVGLPGSQCVGTSSVINGRTYYQGATGSYVWLGAGSSLGTDCDDTNANLFQSVPNLLTDADQDGFTVGAAAAQCVGATTSAGGRTYYRAASGLYTWLSASSSLGTDCNDGNSAISGPATYYADGDSDGRGGTTTQVVCTPPAGYVAVGGDCDDTNGNIYQDLGSMLTDVDQDGYSTGGASSPCVGGSTTVGGRSYYRDQAGLFTWLPAGASLGADCDDANLRIFTTVASLVTDADQDGYSIGAPSSECVGATQAVGGRTYYSGATGVYSWLPNASSLGNDCNDSNASISGPATYYFDADFDGRGGTISQVSCAQPAGYVAVGGDCDDSNQNMFQTVASLALDGDQDGYILGPAASQCVGTTTLVAGRTYYAGGAGTFTWLPSASSLGADCDDGNAAVHGATTWFQDGDGDGHGTNIITLTQCTQPVGYVATGGDCDDGNANIYQLVSVFDDTDQDGWTDGTILQASRCVGPTTVVGGRTYFRAAGGAYTWIAFSLGTDCNDLNGAVFQLVTNVVADDDRDGYPLSNTQFSNVCAGATSMVGSPARTYYAASAAPNDYWMLRGDCINRSGNNCNAPFDCYDLNANARPGQLTYFASDRGDGSFDYDCSGSATTVQSGVYCATTTAADTFTDGTCLSSLGTQTVCPATAAVSAPAACGRQLVGGTTYYNPGTCSAVFLMSASQVTCR